MKKNKQCPICKTEMFDKDIYCSDCQKVNIMRFGAYRMGLTNEEIKEYLSRRANTKAIAKLVEKFNRIAGCNTCTVGPQGQHLMYRHDILRFADVLFGVTRGTYFD